MMLALEQIQVSRDSLPIFSADGPLGLQAGEWACVEGAAATGKSALLDALMKVGNVRITGALTLDGKKLAARAGTAERARLGLRLLPADRWGIAGMTVGENFRIARADPRSSDAGNEFIQTHGHQSFQSLSGGEKTILGILMGVLSGGKCILIDDVFEGVDTENRQKIVRLVASLSEKNISGVMVTRGRPVDKLARKKIWWIADGKLLEII